MLDRYLADLAFSDKRYLKEQLQEGFIDGEIDMNTMRLVYNEDTDIVTVRGLIRDEGIDGTQLLLPDLKDLVNAVFAAIPVYATEAEEAEALHNYLLELPKEDLLTLRRRLPEIQEGNYVQLGLIEYLYDPESDTIRIDLETGRYRYDTRDELFLSWAAFEAVVRAVTEEAEEGAAGG